MRHLPARVAQRTGRRGGEPFGSHQRGHHPGGIGIVLNDQCMSHSIRFHCVRAPGRGIADYFVPDSAAV